MDAVVDKAEIGSVLEFLQGAPGITLLPNDDPFEGLRGFVAFYVTCTPAGETEERSLWLAWRYGKPVPETDREPFRMDEVKDPQVLEDVEKLITECVTEPGWVRCDDPKRLVVGFAKHVRPEDDGETDGMFITISAFKFLSPDVQKKVTDWWATKDPVLALAISSGTVPAV